MKETIRLKYVLKGEMYFGKIDRNQLIDYMTEISKMFADNNEISTKLLEILPNIVCITINEDINDTQDVPYIIYAEVDDRKPKVLKIRRNHRIIWAFLQRYCDEAVN